MTRTRAPQQHRPWCFETETPGTPFRLGEPCAPTHGNPPSSPLRERVPGVGQAPVCFPGPVRRTFSPSLSSNTGSRGGRRYETPSSSTCSTEQGRRAGDQPESWLLAGGMAVRPCRRGGEAPRRWLARPGAPRRWRPALPAPLPLVGRVMLTRPESGMAAQRRGAGWNDRQQLALRPRACRPTGLRARSAHRSRGWRGWAGAGRQGAGAELTAGWGYCGAEPGRQIWAERGPGRGR